MEQNRATRAASEYVKEATEAYFAESNPITAAEVRQAAAGLVTLLLLGALLVSRIL